MSDETRPQLDQVNFVVKDMDAMTEFYGRLGVRIHVGPPEWQPHHRNSDIEAGAHVDFDSPQFASRWNSGWEEGRTGLIVGFKVESVEAVDRLHAELTAAGYVSQQEPYDAIWGARYAVVVDPDGNSVGLMSPIDRSRATRAEPPI